MPECENERGIPGSTGVLNNAIWRRGVATLCVLCRAYRYHIRLHFEPSCAPALSPASCTPFPPLFAPVVSFARTRPLLRVYRQQSNVDWKILMGLSIRYPQPAISSSSRSPSSTSERMLFPLRYASEFQ